MSESRAGRPPASNAELLSLLLFAVRRRSPKTKPAGADPHVREVGARLCRAVAGWGPTRAADVHLYAGYAEHLGAVRVDVPGGGRRRGAAAPRGGGGGGRRGHAVGGRAARARVLAAAAGVDGRVRRQGSRRGGGAVPQPDGGRRARGADLLLRLEDLASRTATPMRRQDRGWRFEVDWSVDPRSEDGDRRTLRLRDQSRFQGLVSRGSTCYANSVLKAKPFPISPLRLPTAFIILPAAF